jgi:hypothetical protein
MLNAKAFAGGLMLAIASLLGGAVVEGAQISGQGLIIDAQVVAGGPSSPASGAGLGVVAENFLIGTTEVTNSQYKAFLDAVGSTNANNVWIPEMGSHTLGGITQSGSSGSFTYSVKSGTAPNGASYATMPVNFVNFYSAARFVNWLATGNTENGSYALNGNNVVVNRTPGATIFLPNANEFFKAAYHNPNTNTWNTTAVGGSATAAAPPGSAGNANFSDIVAGPTNVGAYTSAPSPYGTFDMLGNMVEIVEGSTAGTIHRVGGNWFAGSFPTSSSVPTNFNDAELANTAIGFRVAAVPEPSTLALAGVAISGLAGYEWSRRRKVKAALAG